MERTVLVKNIRDTLSKAGFYVSDFHSIRLSGFDIVARRDNTLLIIKVLTNIDSFSEDVANEIQTLASLLKAHPLLIGEKTGFYPLEDGVVYFRFGIHTITLDTLRNHLFEGMPIKAFAAPGGLYANLDEEKIQMLRHKQGISLGSFARTVRVSRKTAQLYEQGMNARIEIASRIEEVLEDSVTVPIDILQPQAGKITEDKAPLQRKNPLEAFQQDIFSILESVGYKIIHMEKCPFEAVSKERESVLLTSAHKYDRRLVQKAYVMSKISKITEKHAVVFTDRETSKTNVEGTPLIKKKELRKIRDPEEIIELIIERM